MKLSICMPTYNRREKALIQVKNIIGQCAQLSDVEFVVSDNYSTDDTEKYIRDNLAEIPPFMELQRQKENLGLVGNLYYLFNAAKGEYVWFVSDDDLVKGGAVESVLHLLNSNPRDFYLLNFDIEQNGVNNGLFWKHKSDDYKSEYVDGQTGGFALLSAQILKKEKFIQLYDSKKEYNLMQPQAVSFYGLFQLNGIMVFDRAYVIHHAGDYSWAEKYVEVQSIYLYKAIIDIKKYVSQNQEFLMLNLISRTKGFRINSFKYLLKSRDKWYFSELIKCGMLKDCLVESMCRIPSFLFHRVMLFLKRKPVCSII